MSKSYYDLVERNAQLQHNVETGSLAEHIAQINELKSDIEQSISDGTVTGRDVVNLSRLSAGWTGRLVEHKRAQTPLGPDGGTDVTKVPLSDIMRKMSAPQWWGLALAAFAILSGLFLSGKFYGEYLLNPELQKLQTEAANMQAQIKTEAANMQAQISARKEEVGDVLSNLEDQKQKSANLEKSLDYQMRLSELYYLAYRIGGQTSEAEKVEITSRINTLLQEMQAKREISFVCVGGRVRVRVHSSREVMTLPEMTGTQTVNPSNEPAER